MRTQHEETAEQSSDEEAELSAAIQLSIVLFDGSRRSSSHNTGRGGRGRGRGRSAGCAEWREQGCPSNRRSCLPGKTETSTEPVTTDSEAARLTDEDFARRLQEEADAEERAATAASGADFLCASLLRDKDDEQMAKQLQAEADAELAVRLVHEQESDTIRIAMWSKPLR